MMKMILIIWSSKVSLEMHLDKVLHEKKEKKNSKSRDIFKKHQKAQYVKG